MFDYIEIFYIGSACTRPRAIAPRPRRGPAWKGSPCSKPHDLLIPSLHSQGAGPNCRRYVPSQRSFVEKPMPEWLTFSAVKDTFLLLLGLYGATLHVQLRHAKKKERRAVEVSFRAPCPSTRRAARTTSYPDHCNQRRAPGRNHHDGGYRTSGRQAPVSDCLAGLPWGHEHQAARYPHRWPVGQLLPPLRGRRTRPA